MSMAIVAGVVVAGTAAYGAYSANQTAKEAKAANNAMKPLDLQSIPNPQMVDWQRSQQGALNASWQNMPQFYNIANGVNSFNLRQAVRNYSTIQPYFRQNQELIGRNAASFARGELPSDVVSSLGRAAAQRGLSGGFGMGARGGGANTALGGLNLRNLGLTSLQLSQAGTELAMRANQQAASMSPGLFDMNNLMVSPGQAIQNDQFNAGTLNRWNEANTNIANQEMGANTQLTNQTIQNNAQLDAAARQANVQALQSASGTVAGLYGSGAFAGNSGGFFANPQQAQNSIGQYGGFPSSSQYGWAVRPNTVS